MHDDAASPGGAEVRRAWGLAAALAAATFCGYMVGASRAFNYDSAVTMNSFVTGSLSDVFRRQVAYNNHPLLSFVEHMVFVATGSSAESTMRVAPALFAAAAVGILTWRVSIRWGIAAGAVGGLVLAAHPTLTSQREVRGYTLAVLAIVIMGVAALDINRPALFAVGLAVAVGTHIYAVIPGAALLVFVWRSRGLTRAWLVASAAGFAAGFACYLGMLNQMLHRHQVRQFRPRFPLDASWELLGGEAIAAVALGILLVAAARRGVSPPVLFGCAVLAMGVLVPWVLAPDALFPRFVYFAAPALALGASAAVRHDRRFVFVGVVAAAAMLLPRLDTWTSDAIPNRQLARVATGRVCGVGWPTEALRWYMRDLVTGTDCPTAAILLPKFIPQDAANARLTWPALCWTTDDAELRALAPTDCPPQ